MATIHSLKRQRQLWQDYSFAGSVVVIVASTLVMRSKWFKPHSSPTISRTALSASGISLGVIAYFEYYLPKRIDKHIQQYK